MSEPESFVPTPAQCPYGAAFGHYYAPDWAESMLTGIMGDWERVYWNVNQESWPDRWDQEPTKLGSVYYRPYAWGACDCGGHEPIHADNCRLKLEHAEWNRRRLNAMSDPPKNPPTDEEIEAASADVRFGLLCTKYSRTLIFDEEREAKFLATDPRPPCTCGVEATWEEHPCADTCVSQLPNFGIDNDPIQIRWYKHYRRGLSVNLPLTNEQWITWHDRVQAALLQADEAAREAWYKQAKAAERSRRKRN